ncbi:hypothetical protein ES708_22494 [subsurface metagenome]
MFNHETNLGIPQWTPRPDYFFLYYFQNFFGDHMITSSVEGSNDFEVYVSKFSSGEIGVVVCNKGEDTKTLQLKINDFGYGDRYYLYSLTPGDDNGDYSQQVFINNVGPDIAVGGPINGFPDLSAWSDEIGSLIRFQSPGYSVQYILIEEGDLYLTGIGQDPVATANVYPNPSEDGKFTLELPEGASRVEVTDINGRVIYSKELISGTQYLMIELNSPRGMYVAKILAESKVYIAKLIVH